MSKPRVSCGLEGSQGQGGADEHVTLSSLQGGSATNASPDRNLTSSCDPTQRNRKKRLVIADSTLRIIILKSLRQAIGRGCRKGICTIPQSTQTVLHMGILLAGGEGGGHPHREKTVITASGYSSRWQ